MQGDEGGQINLSFVGVNMCSRLYHDGRMRTDKVGRFSTLRDTEITFCPSVTTGLSRSPPTFLPVYLPTYIHSFVHTDEHTYINTYRYIDLASISPLPSSSNMTS